MELLPSETCIEFAIVNKIDGCVATFLVGNHGMFRASSQDNLLPHKYEIRKWLDFLITVDSEIEDYA